MRIANVTLASGTKVSYREAGADNATAIVQVHGLGTGHRNYDLLTPRLEPRLHVYDIDLPGYGDSEQAGHARSMSDFAEDVAQFIEALELAPVHLHGTSMGGCIAMVLAGRRPELVDRLVVTCGFARFDHASHVMFDTWRMAAAHGSGELALITTQQGFSRSFWDRPESEGTVEAFEAALGGMTPAEFLRDLEAMEHADISGDVARISAPTLLLGADEDVMTPMQAAPSGLGMTDLHTLIPGSVLEVLDECGHFISIERPDDTARAIADFVLAA